MEEQKTFKYKIQVVIGTIIGYILAAIIIGGILLCFVGVGVLGYFTIFD